jgi:glycine oxidase
MQPDALVVGGGIIGAACAHGLARRGMRVTLLDQPHPGAATQAAAGMLAPFAEARAEDPFLGFCVRARDYYHELRSTLEAETGIDIGLWTEGILQVAFSEEDVNELRSAMAWQRQSGYTVEWLSVEDLREYAPGIGPEALGAALAPEDGGLDPTALHRALLESGQRHATLDVEREHADQLLFEAGRVTGVRTATGERHAGSVIISAGAWSGQLKGLPRPLPVEPVRGQMAALLWPAGEPRAVVYGGGGYVVERNGEAIAGSTMERVGFDPSTTDEGLARVLTAAQRLYPALGNTPVTRTWAGFRPVTPDGRPMVGQDTSIPNLWYATGHGRNGILLAGITGEVVAQLITGEEVDYDLSLLAPDRSWVS